MLRYRRYCVRLLLFILPLLLTTLATACGGFFCTNVPVDQSGERIIFTINGDGTITAITGIAYSGTAAEFSWLVPLPSVPQVDVAETETLDLLQQATEKTFTVPPNPCEGIIYSSGGFGGGGGGMDVIIGNVGPYDYAILDENDPILIVRWLRSNGYNVQDTIIPAIEHYVRLGMVFLAMKLSQDAEVGDIQPVVMTYKAEKAAIPLILTSVAALQDMPVLVWIFGDTQYVPENYAHPRVDFRQFRAPPEITNVFSFADPGGDYLLARNRFQDQFDGKAFITEFAAPTNSFQLMQTQGNGAGNPVDDPLLLDLMTRFKYLTRLRAQLSPEQMTLDPSFVAAPGAQPVPLDVDLNEHVDPLHYWGCSTRELLREDTALLEKFTQFDDMRVGTPASWQLSTFTINNPVFDSEPVVIHAFAPENVNETTLRAYIAGQPTLPMLVVFTASSEFSWWQARQVMLELLEIETYQGNQNHAWLERTRFQLLSLIEESENTFIQLLTSADDYEQNKAVYEAMLGYTMTYPFYAHPELLNTVFLTLVSNGFYPGYGIYMGYPEGWVEHFTDDNLIRIQPEDAVDDTAPTIEIFELPAVIGKDEDWVAAKEWIPALVDLYQLDAAAQESLTTAAAQSACPLKYPVVAFEQADTSGYIGVAGMYVVIASAPSDVFVTYQADLQKSAESFAQSDYPCG